MFQLLSSFLLLVIVILSVFCKTTTERADGWRGHRPTRWGWTLIAISILAFSFGAGTQSLTQYQKGKVVSLELKLACNQFLQAFFVPYMMSVIKENTSTPNFKPNLDQDQKEKVFIEYISSDGGDIETLIKNGTTKRLFEASLQFDISGQGNFQQTFESKCKEFKLVLADIIGRYQSVMSSGQLIALTNVRDGSFLREIQDAHDLLPQKRQTLKDYYITQDQFDDFLRSVDNLRQGRFTPF